MMISGPIPSINSIVNHRYKGVGSTKLLESYPTFVIDRILKKRRIKFTEDMPILEKLISIELFDSGLEEDVPLTRKYKEDTKTKTGGYVAIFLLKYLIQKFRK